MTPVQSVAERSVTPSLGWVRTTTSQSARRWVLTASRRIIVPLRPPVWPVSELRCCAWAASRYSRRHPLVVVRPSSRHITESRPRSPPPAPPQVRPSTLSYLDSGHGQLSQVHIVMTFWHNKRNLSHYNASVSVTSSSYSCLFIIIIDVLVTSQLV